jgi:6,7-dimethyl-8-ribityllumazine synthase
VNRREIEGDLDAGGLHIGIAVSSWNQTITDRLLDGALQRCEALGVSDVTVLRVPGALELPVAAQALAERGCDAVVALGAVVKGETDHYDIVVRDSSSGVSQVALRTGVPVANGILAVHDVEQAIDRSATGDSNKGREAVDAAVMSRNALAELGET